MSQDPTPSNDQLDSQNAVFETNVAKDSANKESELFENLSS